MQCQQRAYFLNYLKKIKLQQAGQTKNSLSLSRKKIDLTLVIEPMFIFLWKIVEKISRLEIRVVPALNHEKVRSVLTERSDQLWRKMLFYILVSVEISWLRASIMEENKYDDFVKVMQDSTVCFHLFRLHNHFIRQPMFGSSHKALWEIHINSCLTIMQFTRISSLCIGVIVRACCTR